LALILSDLTRVNDIKVLHLIPIERILPTSFLKLYMPRAGHTIIWCIRSKYRDSSIICVSLCSGCNVTVRTLHWGMGGFIMDMVIVEVLNLLVGQ
jgi:hypothetical protein